MMQQFMQSLDTGPTSLSACTHSAVLPRCAGTNGSSWFKILSSSKDMLLVADPQHDTTGRNGSPGLWSFGRP